MTAERSAQSQHKLIHCSEVLVVWPSRSYLLASNCLSARRANSHACGHNPSFLGPPSTKLNDTHSHLLWKRAWTSKDQIGISSQRTNNFENKFLYVLEECLWLFQRRKVTALLNDSEHRSQRTILTDSRAIFLPCHALSGTSCSGSACSMPWG